MVQAPPTVANAVLGVSSQFHREVKDVQWGFQTL